MTWFLHRLGEIIYRVVVPAGFLLNGILLLIYGTSRLPHHADGPAWTTTLIGGAITVGSILLLVFMNTRRARESFRLYVIPDDDDEGSKTDSEQ